ncbi:unnamed protein product, partial [Prorocentrum cordatum]
IFNQASNTKQDKKGKLRPDIEKEQHLHHAGIQARKAREALDAAVKHQASCQEWLDKDEDIENITALGDGDVFKQDEYDLGSEEIAQWEQHERKLLKEVCSLIGK